VEALFYWQGDHHSHRSPTLAVPPITNQASTGTSFHIDGFPSTDSFCNKVEEFTSNKVENMLSHLFISTSIVLQNASLSFEIYVE